MNPALVLATSESAAILADIPPLFTLAAIIDIYCFSHQILPIHWSRTPKIFPQCLGSRTKSISQIPSPGAFPGHTTAAY